MNRTFKEMDKRKELDIINTCLEVNKYNPQRCYDIASYILFLYCNDDTQSLHKSFPTDFPI